MHPVLLNDELLRVICGFLYHPESDNPGSALVPLTCVSRSTSEVALDFIWREIFLEDIFFLFSENMVTKSKVTGEKSFSRLPTTLLEWTRFNAHASRVRSLNLIRDVGPLRKITIPMNERDFTALIVQRTLLQLPLFPNLTDLRWRGYVSHLQDVVHLLGATLVSVELEILSFGVSHDVTGAAHDTMANILQSLTEKCLRLRRLHLKSDARYRLASAWENPILEDAIIPFFRQYALLVDIMVTPTSKALQTLAHSPCLRMLTLGSIMIDEEQDTSNFHEGQSNNNEDPRFVALERLTVLSSISVSFLARRLGSVGCVPRKNITVRVTEICTESGLALFLSTITHPHISSDLRQFRLYREVAMNDLDDSDSLGISWELFRPLLAFPNLQDLEVSDGIYLRTNDLDLAEMARAWPALRNLKLSTLEFTKGEHDRFMSHITFQGLDHLATLPQLTEVVLTLDSEAELLPSMLTSTRAAVSPLTTITFGPGVVTASPSQIALFLVQRFPRLQKIHCMGYDDAKLMWREVAAGLNGARDVLRERLNAERSS